MNFPFNMEDFSSRPELRREAIMTKRVIECNICGEPLAAATDDELVRQVRDHHESEHAGEASMNEQQAREMIAREAYDAADA